MHDTTTNTDLSNNHTSDQPVPLPLKQNMVENTLTVPLPLGPNRSDGEDVGTDGANGCSEVGFSALTYVDNRLRLLRAQTEVAPPGQPRAAGRPARRRHPRNRWASAGLRGVRPLMCMRTSATRVVTDEWDLGPTHLTDNP